jgi:hypothetical protein
MKALFRIINSVNQFMKFVRTISVTSFLLFALMSFCMVIFTFALSNNRTIYFYSTETNINNFKSLKMGFDRYLSKLGSFEFQPFIAKETFEKHIKDKENCLLIISSWHFRSINKANSLLPVLVGLQEGKKFQKRILVTIEQDESLDSINAGVIASASSPEHTKSVLEQMFKGKPHETNSKILIVPKDIDALMSVGFGMSTSALTTQSAFKQLERINPKLYKKMKILEEGKESLCLILAVPKSFEKNAVNMVNMIKEMMKNPDGIEKIKMLGIDGWQELDRSDCLKLGVN